MADESIASDLKWIGLTAGALAGLFAVLSYKTDNSIGWLENNEPYPFGVAAGAFLIGGGILAWTLTLDRRSDARRRRSWRFVGYFVLTLGAVTAVVTAVLGSSAHRQISVEAASFKTNHGALDFDVSVTGDRLKNNDRLVAFLDQLVPVGEAGKAFHVTHLRAESFAAGPNGGLTHPLEIELPPGTYQFVGAVTWLGGKHRFDAARDCYNHLETGPKRRDIVCTVLRVPRAAEMPQLSVAWRAGKKSTQVLIIKFAARYTNDRPAALSVTGIRSNWNRVLLAAYSFEPDVNGTFARTLRVEVPRRFASVCLVATISSSSTVCPKHPQRKPRPGTTWALMRRPGS